MRRFVCIVALLALSACKLDVTQTVDVTQKGREVITYRETLDDEAFSAAAQLGGPSAFGFDAAKDDGWDVRGSSGPNEHIFVFERSFTRRDIEPDLTRLAFDSASATPSDAFLLGPTAMIGLPISASTSTLASVPFPALLRPSEAEKKGEKNLAFRLANARVNAAAVDSVVHVSIELRDATGVHRVQPSFGKTTMFVPASNSTLHIGHAWPLSGALYFWREVGPYGTFDYEHQAPPLCATDTKYRKAWMFGVGVYADGAGIAEHLMTNAMAVAESWLAKRPVKCP